jgi:hypothetical protein
MILRWHSQDGLDLTFAHLLPLKFQAFMMAL